MPDIKVNESKACRGHGPTPYDSIQMKRRLNNERPNVNDRSHKKYSTIFFNYLQTHVRNENYITTNLLENLPYFLPKKTVIFVLNHYHKLAPDLNQQFLLFKFSTIFQDKIIDFYLIYDKLSVKSCIILSIYFKILLRYQKTFDN